MNKKISLAFALVMLLSVISQIVKAEVIRKGNATIIIYSDTYRKISCGDQCTETCYVIKDDGTVSYMTTGGPVNTRPVSMDEDGAFDSQGCPLSTDAGINLYYE